MTARLRKELHQLAPWPLLASLLLFTTGPYVRSERGLDELTPMLFVLLAVFIPSAKLFGAEFDLGTITRLLSQPVARIQLWREKMFVLGVTTAFSFVGLQLARYLFFGPDSAAADVAMCLVAFAGGPLTSLYFRQSFLGFFGAITLPALAIWIWLLGVYLVRGDVHVGVFWVHVPPTILYVPVAYVVARRLFSKLELTNDARRTLAPTSFFRARAPSKLGAPGRLLLKELQIQAPNLLLVPLALVIWSAIYGVALISTDVAWLGPAAVFAGTGSALLTLIFPLMLGATAVAAEREMGVADWHASLPVSRRLQWGVKVLAVLGLALAANAISRVLDRPLLDLLEARQVAMLPVEGWTTGVWLLTAAAAVYASSRAREPLRAVMGAIAILVFACIPATSISPLEMKELGLGDVFLPGFSEAGRYLGVALASLALVSFAFASFRPEPWHWDRGELHALRFLVLAGLLLTIGLW